MTQQQHEEHERDQKRAPRVVCFGAGRVAGPFVEYLLRHERASLCIASAIADEAEQLSAKYRHLVEEGGRQTLATCVVDVLDEAQYGDVVDELCAQADCVVALVPEPAQIRVAQACVKAATPLVTASYASPGIKALDRAAKDAKIPILCEMGLDPGMDHMIAMKLINQVKAKNGTVVSFSSVCGGLPAPDAANNPVKYKFSWSPQGALRAAQRPAQYLKDGETITIAGPETLAHHESVDLFPEHELEQIPNGYSLKYAEYYEIPEVKSLFRGTLRFKGFCHVFHKCVQLGFLDEDSRVEQGASWRELLAQRMKQSGIEVIDTPTQVFLHWLGIDSPGCVVAKSQSTMGAFSDLLVEKLSFAPGERDLVLMQVAVGAEYPDGSQETLEAFFDAFGEANGDTIMAKTVGLTAAIGVSLVLSGKVASVGIVSPTQKEVYEPSLELLAAEGIHFQEQQQQQPESITLFPRGTSTPNLDACSSAACWKPLPFAWGEHRGQEAPVSLAGHHDMLSPPHTTLDGKCVWQHAVYHFAVPVYYRYPDSQPTERSQAHPAIRPTALQQLSDTLSAPPAKGNGRRSEEGVHEREVVQERGRLRAQHGASRRALGRRRAAHRPQADAAEHSGKQQQRVRSNQQTPNVCGRGLRHWRALPRVCGEVPVTPPPTQDASSSPMKDIQVIATDLADGMLARLDDKLNTRPRYQHFRSRIKTMQMDGQLLNKLDDNSVDIVGSNFGLSIFPDRVKAWGSTHRVLKHGGVLFATVWDSQSTNLRWLDTCAKLACDAQHAMEHASDSGNHSEDPQVFVAPSTKIGHDAIASELHAAGFRDIEMYRAQHSVVCESPSSCVNEMLENPGFAGFVEHAGRERLEGFLYQTIAHEGGFATSDDGSDQQRDNRTPSIDELRTSTRPFMINFTARVVIATK